MRPDIAEQDRSYRRGLVLGLTMAEIMVLVIFILLLALAAALAKSFDQIKQKDAIIAALMPDAERQQSVDDIMRDLRAAQERTRELEKEIDRLRPIESRVAQADRMIEALKKAGANPDMMKDLQAVADRLDIAEQVMQQAGRDGAKPSPEKIAGLLAAAREGEQKIANLQGQNKYLVERIKALGKGSELPSCWTTPEGSVEYIFDVLITADGVIIKDNAIPHRAEEQARLPIKSIRFGVEISQDDFRQQVRPLFDWSDREKCRFYVRIRSAERAMRKDIFGTVTDNFYFRLIRQ